MLFNWSSAGDNTCRESLSSPVTCFNEEGLQDYHLHRKQINQSWTGKLNVLKCLAPKTAIYKDISTVRDTGESLCPAEESTENQMNRRTHTQRNLNVCTSNNIFLLFLHVGFSLKNIFNLLPHLSENARSLEAVRQPWIN